MILLITANGYCTELYFGEDMENIIKILEIMVVLLFGLLMLFIATYIILLLYNVGKYIIYKIEQKVINNIIENRKRGKKHHIIINAEGIGHSASMAKRIEAATGVETRATILGHMQRGGSPTCKDRVYASTMGALAVDLLCEGKSNRVVGYRHGDFVDDDIDEALAMQKCIPEYQYQISKNLSM